MKLYCEKCGRETEYQYVTTHIGRRGEKREVYRCAGCRAEKEYVVT